MKINISQLLLATSLICSTLSVAAETTVLQFNRWVPSSHFIQPEVLEAWADDVESATEGRVKIQFTASSLGPPARQFDLIRSSIADIVWSPTGYLPGRFPASEIAEIPFVGDNAEAISVAYWRTYNKHLVKSGEFDGVKLLSLHVQPPGEIHTNKVPLNSLANLKGLKLRVSTPSSGAVAKAVHAVGMSGPSTQVYELLSRGIVDGNFSTADGIPMFNLQNYIHHRMVVDGGFFNAGFFLAMSERAWNKLDAVDQNIIEKLSGEAFAIRAGKMWDKQARDASVELEKQGMTTTKLTGDELAELKSSLSNIDETWIAEVSKKGVDGASALQMFRKEAADYLSK